MATTSVCVITTIVIFLVGAQTCLSLECTGDNLDKCERDNVKDDCPQYRALVRCLESIEDCQDERLKSDVAYMLDRYRGSITDCPGLPDGVCFFHKMAFCRKQIPKGCDDQMGFKQGRECLENIKTVCTGKSYVRYIDYSVKRLDKTITKCGY